LRFYSVARLDQPPQVLYTVPIPPLRAGEVGRVFVNGLLAPREFRLGQPAPEYPVESPSHASVGFEWLLKGRLWQELPLRTCHKIN
jgi:hypothetical protein